MFITSDSASSSSSLIFILDFSKTSCGGTTLYIKGFPLVISKKPFLCKLFSISYVLESGTPESSFISKAVADIKEAKDRYALDS